MKTEMTTPSVIQVRVMSYGTASTIGRIEIAGDDWELYAGGRHPAYQWPEGIAQASDVLTDAELAEYGIDPETTVWLED